MNEIKSCLYIVILFFIFTSFPRPLDLRVTEDSFSRSKNQTIYWLPLAILDVDFALYFALQNNLSFFSILIKDKTFRRLRNNYQ